MTKYAICDCCRAETGRSARARSVYLSLTVLPIASVLGCPHVRVLRIRFPPRAAPSWAVGPEKGIGEWSEFASKHLLQVRHQQAQASHVTATRTPCIRMQHLRCFCAGSALDGTEGVEAGRRSCRVLDPSRPVLASRARAGTARSDGKPLTPALQPAAAASGNPARATFKVPPS
jgi:hypothetical protein